MNEAETKLVALAAKSNVVIDKCDARYYLHARQILKSDPSNKIAQKVASAFSEMIRTGVVWRTCFVFMLPENPLTAEQVAEDESENEAYLENLRAHYATLPSKELMAKFFAAKVNRTFHDDTGKPTGFAEGIRGFQERTGLTDDQILTMPLEQLAVYK